MTTTATAIQNRLRKAYPSLLVYVGRADRAEVTLAEDTEREGTQDAVFVVDFTADRGMFSERIPADIQTADAAYRLLRMYADDLDADQAAERAAVAERIAATGASV